MRSAKSQKSCPTCRLALPTDALYCPNCGRKIPPVKLGISLLIVLSITFGWLLISLLIFSEPSPNILLFVFEFYAVLGLIGVWLVLLVPSAYRAIKATGWKGLVPASAYVLPLPISAVLLVTAVIYQAPLKARLELSEAALIDHADQVQARSPGSYNFFRFIGLFRVQTAYKWDGCTIFVTDSFGPEDEGGLAYCTGELPCAPTVEMHHIRGNWWIWNYWHTNERC